MKITGTSITVRDIEVTAHHGVMPQERAVGNEYLVTVTVRYDGRRAVLSDDINHTVNYAAIVDIVHAAMYRPSALLEHVAGRIAAAIVETFPAVTSGTVEVTKKHPPFRGSSAGATFTLEFGRKDTLKE